MGPTVARHCETFEHTADVGLTAQADSLAELFEALGEGLADLICPRRAVRPQAARIISREAEDVEALAVDFLGDVMLTIQSDRFAIAKVSVREIDANSVRAEVSGCALDAEKHTIATEVKAVTYHELSIEEQDGLWTGRVILDI